MNIKELLYQQTVIPAQTEIRKNPCPQPDWGKELWIPSPSPDHDSKLAGILWTV